MNTKNMKLAFAGAFALAATALVTTPSANAAGLVAPVNTVQTLGAIEAPVVKVGAKKRKFKRKIRRAIRHGHYYGGYYGHRSCHWEKRRFWNDYHGYFYFKRVKVCY